MAEIWVVLRFLEGKNVALEFLCHKFVPAVFNFLTYLLFPLLHPAAPPSSSADDEETGQKVAIKKIPNWTADLIDAKRIVREIKLMEHCNGHENVGDRQRGRHT